MSKHPDIYDAHQRARFMRHDAARFMRPDAARWIRPDVARFLKPGTDPADVFVALKYSPTQRRIPAGRTGGGRWTDEEQGEGGGGAINLGASLGGGEYTADEEISDGSDSGATAAENSETLTVLQEAPASETQQGNGSRGYDDRLASSDKPSLDRVTMLGVLARAAGRVIEAYRSANSLFDLFGHSDGAVAYTSVDEKDIFGANSTSPTYTSADFKAATELRDNLVAKYPDVMRNDNIGRAPNNALFHAETNVLQRAAEANGGSLAGRSLEVYVDRAICGNCRSVLPLVGLELGNPTLTFVDPQTIYLIKDGTTTSRSRR